MRPVNSATAVMRGSCPMAELPELSRQKNGGEGNAVAEHLTQMVNEEN